MVLITGQQLYLSMHLALFMVKQKHLCLGLYDVDLH